MLRLSSKSREPVFLFQNMECQMTPNSQHRSEEHIVHAQRSMNGHGKWRQKGASELLAVLQATKLDSPARFVSSLEFVELYAIRCTEIAN